MILVRCSNCNETLEVDDAFAGGVCRCRHCGTIQSVPENAPKADEHGLPTRETVGDSKPTKRPQPAAAPAKKIYHASDGKDAGASGLDELAEIVASSGMSGSGLARRTGRSESGLGRLDASAAAVERQSPPPPKKSGNDRRLALIAILAVALAATMATLLVIQGRADDDEPVAEEVDETAVGTFAGLTLGRKTVFLVDRGTQTQPAFDAIRAAVERSVEDLPGGCRFQVIFWANPLDPDAPEDGVVYSPGRVPRTVTDDTLAALREDFETVNTGGATDVMPALSIALSSRPDVIVLVTGNGWTFDNSFAGAVLGSVGTGDAAKAIVHTVAAGNTSDGNDRPLAKIAKSTGGAFAGITSNGLYDAAR